MKLREYQQEAVDNTIAAYEKHQAALIVLATGLGKTVCAAHIADHFKNLGRIMLLAHREELITQGKNTLERVTGLDGEVEMASDWAAASSLFQNKMVCTTVQTQTSRNGGRMQRFDPNEFSLLIVDEAHHATAPTYRQTIAHYRQNPDLKVLGLTATPDRTDEEALGQVFGVVPYEYGILEGINDGWLVPIEQQSIYVEGLDFSEVRAKAGQLNGADLGTVMEFEENLHGMVTPILDLCGEEKTLIFTVTVAQAERMAEILNRHKPDSAFHVSGKTPKEARRSLFRRYAAGEFQYLCNVGVATEGFDEPGIRHVVQARPTLSRCVYTQQIGRGTRPVQGMLEHIGTPELRKDYIAGSPKPKLTVLDFVGNAGKHKLIHVADVLGGNYSDETIDGKTVVDIANEIVDKSEEPREILSALQEAERDFERRQRAAAEAQARAKVKAKSQYRFVKIDPFNILDVTPCREKGWNKGRLPSTKMVEYLRSFGVEPPRDLSFDHCSQLIGRLKTRRNKGLCSVKMMNILQKRGIDASNMSMEEAKRRINEIAEREGWKKRKQA